MKNLVFVKMFTDLWAQTKVNKSFIALWFLIIVVPLVFLFIGFMSDRWTGLLIAFVALVLFGVLAELIAYLKRK